MDASIGITMERRRGVALTLSTILADEFVLQTKTRNAHWNVQGRDFHNKHLFFESQYRELDTIIDEVAERIRSLGHFAPASLKEYAALTHFSEQAPEDNDSLTYIKELLGDHESMILHLRENIARVADEWHDAGTSDFVTGLMKEHEKMAWMLRAHLP